MTPSDTPRSPNPESPAGQRQHHWQQVYESRPSDQLSWFQTAPTLSLSLIRSSGIPLSGRIIDVGGGSSNLIDHLFTTGYRSLTVLDISENALAQSKQRLGPAASQINWIVADILAWNPEQHFDLWHDRAVFHFLTQPEDRQLYVTALKAALPPEGTAIIATFALDGPERCSGLPVRRYSPQTLAAELGNEFTLIETATEDHPTPSGAIQHFVYCRFQRRP